MLILDKAKRYYLVLLLLQLPQQENSFDCGLFLLHYVELFLEEAPVNFNPFKISKFSTFVSHLFPLLYTWISCFL